MVTFETTQASRMSVWRPELLRIPRRATVSLVSLLLVLLGVARADDFWKHKPPSQWSAAEALKLVRRSVWARLEVVVFSQKEAEASYSVSTGTRHCDPDAIDPNGNCMQKGRVEAPVDSSRQMDAAPQVKPWVGILVRWESAAPVAQAFGRLEELGEGPAARFQAPAPRLPADRYVITVKVEEAGRKGLAVYGHAGRQTSLGGDAQDSPRHCRST